MVRNGRTITNGSSDDDPVDFAEVFKELERWNDVAKEMDAPKLRGPRP